MTRRAAYVLLAAAAWAWLVWPAFLRRIWRDERSWESGPTEFLLVHVVLVAVSLAFATAVGVIGVCALRHRRSRVNRLRTGQVPHRRNLQRDDRSGRDDWRGHPQP
ncbi:MAG: hypothetical protein M3P48_11580 [Actinomycetota bacterium]|nr:hypothetical protein [Actinomycetota bacterium]